MSSPEEIQAQIERTRADLSTDVDRLTDKVTPSHVASRQVERIKSRGSSLRDRVMGSADDNTGIRGAGDSVGSAVGSTKDSVTSAVGSAREAVGSAPQAARAQARGNPLAAGLVAFGVGMVIAALMPASDAEQQVAAQAEAKAKELAEPVKQAGQQMAQDMKPSVQSAVEEVKSTAQDATQQTTEQAKSAAQDVQAPIRNG
jgi:hypothetical protein